jgi:hypothetical protein
VRLLARCDDTRPGESNRQDGGKYRDSSLT